MDRRRAQNCFDVKQLVLTLREDDVYAYDMFIAPQYRGHGSASQFLRSSCEELARLGFRRAWGFVEPGNVPAVWLYRTNGWQVVGRCGSWHVLSLLLLTDGHLYLTAGESWKRLL